MARTQFPVSSPVIALDVFETGVASGKDANAVLGNRSDALLSTDTTTRALLANSLFTSPARKHTHTHTHTVRSAHAESQNSVLLHLG